MRLQTRFSDVASILGALVSLIGFGWALSTVVDLPIEILISLSSALLAFGVGWWSKSIATRAARVAGRKRVFLSYAHENRALADQIATVLRGEGARVWLAEERIRPGDDIRAAIERGIDSADSVLVIMSSHLSPWIIEETKLAREKGVRLIPVLTEDLEMPSDLAGLHYVDLRENPDRGMIEIVQASTGSAG